MNCVCVVFVLVGFFKVFVCSVRDVSCDVVFVVFSLCLFVCLYVSVSVFFVFVPLFRDLLCDAVWFVSLCVLCLGVLVRVV